jgi:hypothetical protein
MRSECGLSRKRFFSLDLILFGDFIIICSDKKGEKSKKNRLCPVNGEKSDFSLLELQDKPQNPSMIRIQPDEIRVIPPEAGDTDRHMKKLPKHCVRKRIRDPRFLIRKRNVKAKIDIRGIKN